MDDWFTRLQRFHKWSTATGNRFILIHGAGMFGGISSITIMSVFSGDLAALGWRAALHLVAYIMVLGAIGGIVFGTIMWWLDRAFMAYAKHKRRR
jgi:hypothetical protein